ncbi:CLUMA_CG017344, isoform A [Clunio marinus]|uniref:CLUMA_CG017344, isoform A n=1 Tax=Clunio marinus TaxID=568069 RepID=A0A1J1IX17_9DIPT|nr:CLUMA_CG017344, isoform A [Clunio marinus]
MTVKESLNIQNVPMTSLECGIHAKEGEMNVFKFVILYFSQLSFSKAYEESINDLLVQCNESQQQIFSIRCEVQCSNRQEMCFTYNLPDLNLCCYT